MQARCVQDASCAQRTFGLGDGPKDCPAGYCACQHGVGGARPHDHALPHIPASHVNKCSTLCSIMHPSGAHTAAALAWAGQGQEEAVGAHALDAQAVGRGVCHHRPTLLMRLMVGQVDTCILGASQCARLGAPQHARVHLDNDHSLAAWAGFGRQWLSGARQVRQAELRNGNAPQGWAQLPAPHGCRPPACTADC